MIFRILVLFCILSPVFCSDFDGIWWTDVKVTFDHQIGFLSGQSDCYISERHSRFKFQSVHQEADLLTRFYEDPKHLKIPVRRALMMIKAPPTVPRPEGGESYPEKHGYYDGLWWNGNEPEHGRLGFIEGYVACLPQGQNLFPKNPRVYVKLIDQWYLRNESKELAKIADVLTKFATKIPTL